MRAALSLCLILGLGLIGCEKKSEPVPAVPIDVSLKVELPAEQVSDRLIPVTYEIEPGAGYKAPDCELTAFVHYVGEDGKKLFQDDHALSPRSSEWKPGQKIRTTRLIVLPMEEKPRPISVLMGLYCVEKPQQPFSVSGTPWREGENRYNVASGTIQPYVRPLSDELLAYQDWYGEEYDIPQRLSWRWMGREAKLVLSNRAQDSLLYLEGRVPSDAFTGPSTLRLKLNGKPLGQVSSDADGHVRALYHLKPEDLGQESTAMLVLTLDQTFVPKQKGLSEDDRVLGMMLTRVWYGSENDQTRSLEPRPLQAAHNAPAEAPGETAPETTPAAGTTPAAQTSPGTDASPGAAASPQASPGTRP